MSFQYTQPFPGVYHIQDILGVSMTLLVGEEKALLVDTGYGLEDVKGMVRTLTDRPVTVLLTHGHHDHALGARWFDEVLLFPEDREVFETYTGEYWRKRVLGGVSQECKDTLRLEKTGESFLRAVMPVPADLQEGETALGGLTAQVLKCPGHTPGSAVIYVPERKLLLTGDDWNPCTWLFFPEALPARVYRENMKKLLEIPFRKVLCSHRADLYDREDLTAFVEGLTDEVLSEARPVDTGERVGVRTSEASPARDQIFVFDTAKWARSANGNP